MKRIEQALQRDCTTWIKIQHPKLVWFKIDNEGKRSKIAGVIAKGCGLLAGMPDNGLIIRGVTYYFEFKAPSGKLSESQLKTQEKIIQNEAQVFVIYDVTTFINTVKSLV